jgi:hypothetical protein
MSIVMGLDQHRARIAAEWIETVTGEISRERIAPADRSGVRVFLAPFRGDGLEVALEATTGWRFVVEELERVGAEVHLAEPAEAAALNGKKKRAKTDWAPGHLSRQGPPALRWALYEAAQRARFPASPDRTYYEQLAARIGGNRVHRARAQAPQTLPPHPQRARRPSPAACRRLTRTVTRQARDQPMNRRPAPDRSLPTLQRGPLRKTERPHHHLPEHPITHHVADPEPPWAACRSKPGRPRTHPIPPTRSRPSHAIDDPR